ncbi:Manganese-dependent ADP-ribose/CDP-alcohol diphosphatase [Diplonema papillatum]|nr:Manganese-dependent ADP-ribose/CDP-alcohol diphosphatase [Diplonema papillatum]
MVVSSHQARMRRKAGLRSTPLPLVLASSFMVLYMVVVSQRLQSLRRTTLVAGSTVDVVKVGVVSDLQYADREDGWDHTGVYRRRYRGSLGTLQNAVESWSRDPLIAAALNLGDLLDGWNNQNGRNPAAALQTVQTVMHRPALTWFSAVGNHELYNFDRASLPQLPLSTKMSRRWRLLVLDSYAYNAIQSPTYSGVPREAEDVAAELLSDGSLAGTEHDTGNYAAARRLLMEKNPNLKAGNMTPGAAVWLDGLQGENRKFTPLNGGIGRLQLRWLTDELIAAKRRDEWVVVASHVPIHPSSAASENIIWDSAPVMRALSMYGAGVVALVLSGHDHSGGFAVGDFPLAVPFLTLPSPLESVSASTCFTTITLEAHASYASVHIEGENKASGSSFRVERL